MTSSSLATTASLGNNIEILSIKPSNSAGSIRAFVDIRIDRLIVRNCKVIQQAGQRAWVAPPSQEYMTKAGTKKYTNIIEMDEPFQRELSRIVLAAWESEARRGF